MLEKLTVLNNHDKAKCNNRVFGDKKIIAKVAKTCVHYFSRNFCSSQNDSPSKTMKDVFYFI